MIAVTISADTRKGSGDELSIIGKYGEGSLQGCRSYDFLTDGIEQKIAFFSGHKIKVIVSIDEHERLPQEIADKLDLICDFWECSPKDRASYRWNDRIYTNLFRLIPDDCDYVVHFDQDANAYKSPDSIIVQQYLEWLESGYTYICQPSIMRDHGMTHASTRFFICKRESLNVTEIERCLDDNYRNSEYPTQHLPCVEHILGAMAGVGKVFYPEWKPKDYMIFNWTSYQRGLLNKLSHFSYDGVRDYIESCGIQGPGDVIAKEL